MMAIGHSAIHLRDDMPQIDRCLTRNNLNDLVRSPFSRECPHGKMDSLRRTRFEDPFSICGLTMWRMPFAHIGIFIAAKWHAEKVTSHHPQNRRHRRINLFLGPRRYGKRFNPAIADPESHRRKMSCLPCYRCFDFAGLQYPALLSKNGPRARLSSHTRTR